MICLSKDKLLFHPIKKVYVTVLLHCKNAPVIRQCVRPKYLGSPPAMNGNDPEDVMECLIAEKIQTEINAGNGEWL